MVIVISGGIRIAAGLLLQEMVLVRGSNEKKSQVEADQIRANTKTPGAGSQLANYELGKTLGEGNFGKVKYARDILSGRSFAIKILEKNRILDLKITDQVSLLPILIPIHESISPSIVIFI